MYDKIKLLLLGGFVALSDKDKKDIGEIVEVKITKEIGFLKLEMNQRFDEANSNNKKGHQEILDKIEEIKTMEGEDIQALSDDIVKIKKKIAFGQGVND